MVSNWCAPLAMLMLIGCLFSVSSFKCYQCRSDLHENCKDLQGDQYLLDCTKDADDDVDEIVEEVLNKTTLNPKPHCRKVVQYIYFINESTTTITSRECTKTASHIREDQCYKENFVLFYLYICECKKQGCNAAGSLRTCFRSVLFFLCFHVVFPP